MNPTTILIIVGIIILIIVAWYISVSNKLNRAVVKIDESLSGIDVALTKRYDVLTKMIDVVKAYAKHEKETLFEVINLRKGMDLCQVFRHENLKDVQNPYLNLFQFPFVQVNLI